MPGLRIAKAIAESEKILQRGNGIKQLLGATWQFSNCVHANLRRPYLETCNTKSTTLKRIVLKINQGKFEENVHL